MRGPPGRNMPALAIRPLRRNESRHYVSMAYNTTDHSGIPKQVNRFKIFIWSGGGFSSRGRGGMRTNYNNRGGMSRSFGANPPRAATKSTYGGYSTSQSGFNANQTVGGSSRYDDYDAPRRDDNYDRNRRNVSYQQPSPNENLRGGYNDDQYRHQRAGSGESDRSGQSGRGYGGERDGYYARNEKDSFSRSNLESEYPKWSTGSPNGGTLKVDTRNSVPPPPGLGPRLNQDTLVPPPPGLGRTSHAAPAVPPGLSRASPPAAYSRASPNYGDIQEDRNAFGQSSKTSTWGAPSSYAGSNEDRSQVGQSSRPTWGAPSSYAGSNEDRNQVSTSSKESLRRRFGVSLQKSTEDKNDDAPLIRSESPPRPPAATAPSESIVAQNKISRGKVARAFLSVLLSKNGQPVRIDQLIDLSKNYLKGEDINYLMHVNGGPKIFVEEIVAYKGFLEEYEVRRVLDNHNIEYVVVEKTEVNPPRYDGEAPRERARPTPSSAESAGSSKAGDSDYARAMKLAEDPEVREELIGQMLSIVRQANEENWKPTLEIVSEQVIMMEKMSESFKQFLLNLCIRDDPKMRMATNGLSKNAIVHIVKPEKKQLVFTDFFARGEGLDVWEGLPLPWNDWPHPYFDSFLNGKRERITVSY
ncbi:unnamed protein product [Caenorhabditis auriculariae]|uniref:Uncharacterized protein n=1 Tax=Caenorhabditis auriculariae TaxID=2777116 RepID=A0A8S1HTY3_9PELO|nr:unnamed protein product [Caenorhabditis auriculariae]